MFAFPHIFQSGAPAAQTLFHNCRLCDSTIGLGADQRQGISLLCWSKASDMSHTSKTVAQETILKTSSMKTITQSMSSAIEEVSRQASSFGKFGLLIALSSAALIFDVYCTLRLPARLQGETHSLHACTNELHTVARVRRRYQCNHFRISRFTGDIEQIQVGLSFTKDIYYSKYLSRISRTLVRVRTSSELT